MRMSKRKIIVIVIIAIIVVGYLFSDSEETTPKKIPYESTSVESESITDKYFDDETGLTEATEKLSDPVLVTTKKPNSTKKSTTKTQKNNNVGNARANLSQIPAYKNKPYVEINNNQPGFTTADLTTKSFEKYSTLDSKGRCGVAYACIGQDLMPTGKRGEIGQIKPTGWHTVKYDNVDGRYLYNRCHLIGWQLSGENANEKNLITGTRYMNVSGMLPFENMVADYIKETGNHVLYRVTPIFSGNNLLASGVQIEAYSVEDSGDGIYFNVFCYNVQPGIVINYADGSSSSSTSTEKQTAKKINRTTTTKRNENTTSRQEANNVTYIGNKNTKKFHQPYCSSASQMKESNKYFFYGTRDEIISEGYVPCKNCNP